MLLSELIRDLPDVVKLAEDDRSQSGAPQECVKDSSSSPPDPEIRDLAEDSRKVTPGALFMARAGSRQDGRAFLAEALARGAAAVLVERAGALETESIRATGASVPLLATTNVPGAAARIAERFFGNPSRELRLIGITGTNGKTTTASLTQQFVKAADRRCGLIGTIAVDDGLTSTTATLTTPDAISLSRHLQQMVSNGCAACAMEASSHALAQQRTAGLEFAVGVFTNLTGDHLDYHGSMEAYGDAKAILFEGLSKESMAIVNIDDPAAERMLRACRARVLRCSVRDPQAECFAHLDALGPGFVSARWTTPWGTKLIRLPLTGLHNLMNSMQAAAGAWSVGIAGEVIDSALERCTAPAGRLEPVTTDQDPFSVLVDYAHTDDALDNVLRALRALVPPEGRLRVVFGCGGDRDRTKRPRMAAVACRHADEVIVTSDNPRTEDPEAIVEEILTGVPADRRVRTHRCVDRGEAIRGAVLSLLPGDVLLIAGKGHEDYQIIGTTRRPFDDREVARAALGERRATPIHATVECRT